MICPGAPAGVVEVFGHRVEGESVPRSDAGATLSVARVPPRALRCTPVPHARRDSRDALPVGERMYVTNEGSSDVAIIDTRTDHVVGRIVVGNRPRGIHVAPDGHTLFVALSGSVMRGGDT